MDDFIVIATLTVVLLILAAIDYHFTAQSPAIQPSQPGRGEGDQD